MQFIILAMVLPFVGALMAYTVWRTRPDYTGSTAPPRFKYGGLHGLFLALTIGTMYAIAAGLGQLHPTSKPADAWFLLLSALPTAVVMLSWAVAFRRLPGAPGLTRRQKFETAALFVSFLGIGLLTADMYVTGQSGIWLSYGTMQVAVLAGGLSTFYIGQQTRSVAGLAARRRRTASLFTSHLGRRNGTNLVLTS